MWNCESVKLLFSEYIKWSLKGESILPLRESMNIVAIYSNSNILYHSCTRTWKILPLARFWIYILRSTSGRICSHNERASILHNLLHHRPKGRKSNGRNLNNQQIRRFSIFNARPLRALHGVEQSSLTFTPCTTTFSLNLLIKRIRIYNFSTAASGIFINHHHPRQKHRHSEWMMKIVGWSCRKWCKAINLFFISNDFYDGR